ncbi:MAG: dephospho-CoA kinase [Bacteroidota bacterium]|nr:dephospho-CoA kinase [Bacteroidota bacterium]
MLKIGLTGGIGSGKSTVANIFKVLGIPVFDADSVAKKIMEEDEQLMYSIKKEFGDETYQNGKLNRKYLAGIVFHDAYKLEVLNAIVHPATIKAAALWMEQQQAPYVIKEAALMFESASAAGVDYIIGVYAPKHIRIKRVMERDHVGREEVIARMDKQINEEIKMKLCDFVIINDEQQLLIKQVLRLHEQFFALQERSTVIK